MRRSFRSHHANGRQPGRPEKKRGNRRLSSPKHLKSDTCYNRWEGNPYLNQDLRARGELFYEPSIQSVLNEGGVLGDFVTRTKYPKTLHLPDSPGLQNDDHLLHQFDGLEGEEVVVTFKLDGI